MIVILGDQNLCQQSGSGNARFNDLGGHGFLTQMRAALAGPYAPDMTLHPKHAGHIVQPF